MKKRNLQEAFLKPTKKDIAEATIDNYVVFYDIKWDTDGQKVKLPKAVRVPKENFDEDFDFSLEGADFLSDHYEYCVHSFSFKN